VESSDHPQIQIQRKKARNGKQGHPPDRWKKKATGENPRTGREKCNRLEGGAKIRGGAVCGRKEKNSGHKKRKLSAEGGEDKWRSGKDVKQRQAKGELLNAKKWASKPKPIPQCGVTMECLQQTIQHSEKKGERIPTCLDTSRWGKKRGRSGGRRAAGVRQILPSRRKEPRAWIVGPFLKKVIGKR